MTDKIASLNLRRMNQDRNDHLDQIAQLKHEIFQIEYQAKKQIILKGKLEMLTINWRMVNRHYRGDR